MGSSAPHAPGRRAGTPPAARQARDGGHGQRWQVVAAAAAWRPASLGGTAPAPQPCSRLPPPQARAGSCPGGLPLRGQAGAGGAGLWRGQGWIQGADKVQVGMQGQHARTCLPPAFFPAFFPAGGACWQRLASPSAVSSTVAPTPALDASPETMPAELPRPSFAALLLLVALLLAGAVAQPLNHTEGSSAYVSRRWQRRRRGLPPAANRFTPHFKPHLPADGHRHGAEPDHHHALHRRRRAAPGAAHHPGGAGITALAAAAGLMQLRCRLQYIQTLPRLPCLLLPPLRSTTPAATEILIFIATFHASPARRSGTRVRPPAACGAARLLLLRCKVLGACSCSPAACAPASRTLLF